MFLCFLVFNKVESSHIVVSYPAQFILQSTTNMYNNFNGKNYTVFNFIEQYANDSN